MSTRRAGTARQKASTAAAASAAPPEATGEDTTASCAETPAATASASSQVEIELKLTIAPEDAARIARLPLVRDATIGRPQTRKLHTIYYDTPERALQRAGVALRLRKDGARWLQTLKGGGRSEAGLHERNEIESRVAGPFLDQAMLDANLGGKLADPAARAHLAPLFVTEFRRRLRVLEPAPGTRIELCVDEGSIGTATRSVPIHEIELELQAGSALTLIDFADALVQALPVHLEPLSKAARGYALASDAVAAPVRARAIALTPHLGVIDALRKIVFACVEHLQANEAGVIAGEDAEYLHQARVALRRLRSAFNVFAAAVPRATAAPLLDEFRWLDRVLAPARDWDVFVLETLPPLRAAFPAHAGLDALEQRAASLRAEAGAAARAALRSARYTRLLLQSIALFYRQPWLAEAAPEAESARAMESAAFAASVLGQRQRKVRKRGRDIGKLDHAALHALRIAIKKLRYAAEFFAALHEGKAQRRFVRALAVLQGHLGTLNDAATVERLCRQLTAEDADTLEAIGVLRGWAAARAAAHIEQLPPAWKAWRDAAPYWE